MKMRVQIVTALPHWGAGWLEAILLPALGILLAWTLDPGDPLLLRQPFPWLLIIPLLIALRYELMPALLSVAALASTLFWHKYPEIRSLEIFAGTVLVILIASEYAGFWARQEAGRSLQEEITATRFRQLSDDLYVTRISQDRLEQSLLYQPMSVRSALLEIKNQLAQKQGRLDAELAYNTLYFLNQLVGVQIASLYDIQSGHHSPRLIAAFGNAQPWQEQDPVLRESLNSGESQSLADLEITQFRHYISVHIHRSLSRHDYVLTIEEMSFFAINKESLQTIEVIFQYLCTYAESLAQAAPLLKIWSDCPPEFATDFMQLQKLAQRVPQVGIMVRYDFHTGPYAEKVLDYLQRLRRGLDVLWLHREEEKLQLIVLLPFAGSMAAEGHFQRMRTESSLHYGEEWEKSFIHHKIFSISAQHCEKQIKQLFDSEVSI
ncbi:hypothetical protein H7F10_09490 [Acidithiobacillus sp. HP-6]|uniref:PelD GGDEF domain-containing protein n=1 Tax=unclassified Acidithiobacillus TaxID=2614800 RepID=UPI00187A1420|nr:MULTISPECIES: PelD GGDEF domain-containing protein [unclassified Acidithiobacillus]MBE7563174.1 hypothetical protein [Acidithiobacillus sp. HP-6]MBE7570230.1 hypothetical protein [Acidithiobacillus sp. HP-2]